MGTIHYLLTSTVCISISYLAYLVIARKEKNFKQLRFFLLSSIFISLLIPLNNFHINIPQQINLPVASNQEFISTSEETSSMNLSEEETTELATPYIKSTKTSNTINWNKILKLIYIIAASYLIFRIMLQIGKLIYYTLKAEKRNTKEATLVYSEKIQHPSSFFRWIFLPKNNSYENKEIKEIIEHEKIHVSQYHSLDILLIELLSAVMWFNPFVWMMRNSIQLIHEYLADEGVLNAGVDKNRYQTVLLNQVAEGRLVGLSSSFNQSLIKKRMIMMTKNKIYKHSKSKILVLIPVAAILFVGVACVKGQEKKYLVVKDPPPKDEKVITAVAPVKMNVLYWGVDNPMAIASSGYDASELEVSIDNGRIVGKNGNYIINPAKTGSATVSVSHNGKVIQKSVFRVKTVPDPYAGIPIKNGNHTNHSKGGEISKSKLIEAGKIDAFMQNFDFELEFKVTRFNISGVLGGFEQESPTSGNRFNEEQIEFINKFHKGDKITFSNIYAVGPDGKERQLNPIIFRLNGE